MKSSKKRRFKLKRLMYLGYYAKETDWKQLQSFISYIAGKDGISRSELWNDMVTSSIRYNISLIDYFLFRFYESEKSTRGSYAGTGYMYEYQKMMNPVATRYILENKPDFYRVYAPYIKHEFTTLRELQENGKKVFKILNNPTGKIVLKEARGQCGRGIEVRDASEFTADRLIQRLTKTGNNMVEEFVQQHEKLQKLSPSGLNTVRIITQLDEDDRVDVLGCRLRITVDSPVDNLAAGNIAAPIDLETGIITGPAVYSDITREDVEKHPVTDVEITGFQIPYWPETLKITKNAALKNTKNRSIGWDVAITNEGPELIEGNHDWCKLLWQLPVKKGLKSILDSYKEIYNN